MGDEIKVTARKPVVFRNCLALDPKQPKLYCQRREGHVGVHAALAQGVRTGDPGEVVMYTWEGE